MFDRILVLSPHPDDGELGCGGTLVKFMEEGKEVYYIGVTPCKNTIPEGFPEDTLIQECYEATKILGIPRSNVKVCDFENKRFPRQRYEIFNMLEDARVDIAPDMVFIPSLQDVHQDHHTVAVEAIRAFRRKNTIVAYEEPWNNITITTTAFSPIERRHLDAKLKALDCYASQSFQKRGYFDAGYIESLAKTRGVQINCKYAEAFEIVRWIM